MSTVEFVMCLSAVMTSSISQLCIKGAMARSVRAAALGLLGIGAALLCCSVLLTVLVLRTVSLSQLIPFAAIAHILVPLGGCLIFSEMLTPRFWIGALLILCGILWLHS